jgi:hypothetical protein
MDWTEIYDREGEIGGYGWEEWSTSECEVIGNIYENPDLINKQVK